MRPGTDNPWWLAALCSAALWAAPVLAQQAEGFLVLTDREQPGRRIVWGYDAQGKTWPIDQRAGWGVLPVDATAIQQAWRAWVNVTAHARVQGFHGLYVLDAGITADHRFAAGGPKVVRLLADGEHGVIDEAWWLTPGRELRSYSRPVALAVSADERYAYILDAGTRGLIILDLHRRTAHTALSGQLPISTQPRGKHTLTLDAAGDLLVGESVAEGSRKAQRWQVPVTAIQDPRWPDEARRLYLQTATAPRNIRRPAVVLRPAGMHAPGSTPTSPGTAWTTPPALPPLSLDTTLTQSRRDTRSPENPTSVPQALPIHPPLPTIAVADDKRISPPMREAIQPAAQPITAPLSRSSPPQPTGVLPMHAEVDTDEAVPGGDARTPTSSTHENTPAVATNQSNHQANQPANVCDPAPQAVSSQSAPRPAHALTGSLPEVVIGPLATSTPLAKATQATAEATDNAPATPVAWTVIPAGTRPMREEGLLWSSSAGGVEPAIQEGLFESWVRSREQPGQRGDWLGRLTRLHAQGDALPPSVGSHGPIEQDVNPYLLPAAARWARVGWYRLNDAPDELTTLAAEAARLYTDAAQEHRERGR